MGRVGNSNATVAVAGAVTVDLGTPNYFSAPASITFTGTRTLTGATLRVTASGLCDPVTSCLLRQSQQTAFPVTYRPAATLKDAAGNAAAGTRTATVFLF